MDEDPQQFGCMPTPDESMMGYGMAEASYDAGLWGEVSMQPQAAGPEEQWSLWQPTQPPRRNRRASSAGPPALSSEGVMVRELGTFMESVELRGTDPDESGSKQRSWSDGDLPAFREAMEASDPAWQSCQKE